jgi:hypothetical protein
MDQAVERTPPDQRHVERVQRQFSADALAHGPAHDETRAEIEDHRQVEPAFARGDVGDIRDPRHIRRGLGELPVQDVARDRERVVRVGRGPEPPTAPPGEPTLARQPRQALATGPVAPGAELDVDPRTAVASPARRAWIAAISRPRRSSAWACRDGARPCQA